MSRTGMPTDGDPPPPARVVVDEQGRVGEVVFEASGALYLRLLRIPAEWTVMADSVRPATVAEVAEAARAVCVCCGERTDDPIEVGRTASYSGPPWPVEACPGCVKFRRLMPYSAHPLESLGSVRHVDGSLLREAL